MGTIHHSLVGEVVEWSCASSTIRGLVALYDPEGDAVLIRISTQVSAWVPASECRAEGSSPTSGDADGLSPSEAYLAGLADARHAISSVVVQFAMAFDMGRCAGASRAYGAVDRLIQESTL